MKTKDAIDFLRQSRENQISLLKKHQQQIYTQPDGFKNTLFWNAAHNLVTLQLLVYKLSGQEMKINDEIINTYRKGTQPVKNNPIDFDQLIALLGESVDWLEQDIAKGIFTTYTTYPTSYGITLNSHEEAIAFNNIHEGLHLGYMMAMVKSI